MKRRLLSDFPGEVLLPKEVAQIVGMGVNQTYEAMRRGKLPAVKIGGSWRCSKRRLEKWLEEGPEVEAEAPAEVEPAQLPTPGLRKSLVVTTPVRVAGGAG